MTIPQNDVVDIEADGWSSLSSIDLGTASGLQDLARAGRSQWIGLEVHCIRVILEGQNYCPLARHQGTIGIKRRKRVDLLVKPLIALLPRKKNDRVMRALFQDELKFLPDTWRSTRNKYDNVGGPNELPNVFQPVAAQLNISTPYMACAQTFFSIDGHQETPRHARRTHKPFLHIHHWHAESNGQKTKRVEVIVHLHFGIQLEWPKHNAIIPILFRCHPRETLCDGQSVGPVKAVLDPTVIKSSICPA